MPDFFSNINSDDLSNARNNRNSTVNSPNVDPAMDFDGDDEWDSIDSFGKNDDSPWGDSFGSGGSSSFGGGNSYGGFGGNGGFGGGFGGGGFGSDMGGFGQNQGGYQGGFSTRFNNPQDNMQQQQKTSEDKIFEVIGNFFKGAGTFLKELFQSFSNFDGVRQAQFGCHTFVTSLIMMALGVGLWIMKVPEGPFLLAGSAMSAGASAVIFMFRMDALKNAPKISVPEDDYFNQNGTGDFGETGDWEGEGEDINDIGDISKDYPEEDEDYIPPAIDIGDITPFEDEEEDEEDKEEEKELVDIDSVVDTVEKEGYGTSRKYLFEKVCEILENRKPDFQKSVEYDEDSDEFMSFCSMVDTAANIVAPKSADETLSVMKVTDKLFFTVVELNRPAWLSETVMKKLVSEIVGICSVDQTSYKKNENITGSGILAGNKAFIKIMKGETACVTVKDAFMVMKDTILNTKNKMPVIIGVDEKGDVIWDDFYDVYSMLVTGLPRSGKSWTVLSLIAQLMMFCTPNDVNFIFMDPKARASDFFNLAVPHIRKFISTDDEIVRTMRWLVKEEAVRREQLMFEVGKYKDIKDLHREHPEVKLPYLYVVIDEVITLADRMDKDTKDEFQGYLRELVTRLPSFGIRIIMVPHMIKNDIINKTTTDNISVRLNVRGNAEAIESVIGLREKEFPYKLIYPGDMAARTSKGSTHFVHSTILSDNNNGINRVFNFLTNFWLKLEPESFKGSKLEHDIKVGNRELSEFKFIEGLDLSYLEKTTSKPRVTTSFTKEVEEDGEELNLFEDEEVKESKPVKSRVTHVKSEVATKRYLGDDIGKKVSLDEEVQDDLLEGIHNNIPKRPIRPKRPNRPTVSEDLDEDFF